MAGWFEGKVVIVTGAGGAIGRAGALAFAAEGAMVAVSDIKAEIGEETAQMIVSAGGQGIAVVGDISLDAEVQRLVDAAVKTFGGMDAAFNNAGITHPDDSKWEEASFVTGHALVVDGGFVAQ